jgi:hypothetical protein
MITVMVAASGMWYRLLAGYISEDGRGEGKQRECLYPLSWSVHHNLGLVMVTQSPPVAVSKQDS